MKKTLGIIIVTLIILGIVSYFRYEVKTKLLNTASSTKTINKVVPTTKENAPVDPDGYKNASYVLDGQTIILQNGVSETEIVQGSDTKMVTKYFGNEVTGDFNGDGRNDIAFLLSQETGGTGVFFYLVVALNTHGGYAGSHGYFIGDRIAPQSTQLGEGSSIIVNYADRAPGEPLSAEPTVGKSIKLLLDVDSMVLHEVVKNN